MSAVRFAKMGELKLKVLFLGDEARKKQVLKWQESTLKAAAQEYGRLKLELRTDQATSGGEESTTHDIAERVVPGTHH